MEIRGVGAAGRIEQRMQRDTAAGVERRGDAASRPQRSGRDGGADRVREGVPSARRSQSATGGAEVRSEVDHASRSDTGGVERAVEDYREYLTRREGEERARE